MLNVLNSKCSLLNYCKKRHTQGLEAIWRGSKLEIEGVLRDVCDEVLSDAKCSKSDLANRIHALSLIGTIYQSVISDEPEPTTTAEQESL